MPLDLRRDARQRRDARLGRGAGLRRSGRPRRHPAADRGLLPRRVVRPVRPLPRGDRAAGRAAGSGCGRAGRSVRSSRGTRPAQGDRPGDAGRLDLRAGPDGLQCHRVGSATLDPDRRRLDHERRSSGSARRRIPSRGVPRGAPAAASTSSSTARRCACRRADDPGGVPVAGIDTPTLCYLENLTPVNVCRVCVVELDGRADAGPGLFAPVEPGMEIRTDSPRVRTAGRWCSSSSARPWTSRTAPRRPATTMARYGAGPDATGRRRPAHPAGERDAARAGPSSPCRGRPRRRRSPSR